MTDDQVYWREGWATPWTERGLALATAFHDALEGEGVGAAWVAVAADMAEQVSEAWHAAVEAGSAHPTAWDAAAAELEQRRAAHSAAPVPPHTERQRRIRSVPAAPPPVPAPDADADAATRQEQP